MTRRVPSLVPALVSASLALAASSGLAGCNGCGASSSSLPPEPAASASAAPASSPGASNAAAVPSDLPPSPPGVGRRAGGPAVMFSKAARAVELTPEQKIKLAEADELTKASPSAVRDEVKSLQADLVTWTKAGAIDKAKLEAHWKVLDAATLARQAEDAAAINAVHKALTPAQRAQVSAKLRIDNPKYDDDVQRWITDGGAAASQSKHGLERLTKDLGLDEDQKKKVEAIAAKGAAGTTTVDMRAEAKRHTLALIEGFEKDDFDAAKVPAPSFKVMRGPIGEQAFYVAELLPVLKPEQREKLAARLEKRAKEGGGD